MPILDLAEATWEDLGALDPQRSVAVLPTGAVEAHGPHLPLSTDRIIALAMARAGAARLAERGWTVLLLPPLDYTAAPFAAEFRGTVALRPETVRAVVVDIARAVGAWGVGTLALANAHLDPAHLGSLYAAIEEIEKITGAGGKPRIVFPDITRKPWALRLTEEFRSGACHAGRYETSIVLAARPELVREALRPTLPGNPSSLSTAIREGRSTFHEAGGPRAYFGFPAEATATEGRSTIETLGDILAEAVLANLDTVRGS